MESFVDDKSWFVVYREREVRVEGKSGCSRLKCSSRVFSEMFSHFLDATMHLSSIRSQRYALGTFFSGEHKWDGPMHPASVLPSDTHC